MTNQLLRALLAICLFIEVSVQIICLFLHSIFFTVNSVTQPKFLILLKSIIILVFPYGLWFLSPKKYLLSSRF